MKKEVIMKKLAVVSLVLFFSCAEETVHIKIEEGCNPITTSDCFLPFPSSFFLKEDKTTVTGFRVNYTPSVLPVSKEGIEMDVNPLNEADGFSPVSQILVYFEEGVDPSTIPSMKEISKSLEPDSGIQVIEWETGERVPIFAEVDLNAVGPGGKINGRQGLIIRPQVRLKPKTRYIVLITDKVKSRTGGEIKPPIPFKALRDGKKTDNPQIESMRSKYEEIFSFLSSLGIERKRILLAWDFVTASDEFILSKLLKMREKALSLSEDIEYEWISEVDYPDANSSPHLYKQLKGKFKCPWFLEKKDDLDFLKTNEFGEPVTTGFRDVEFVVHIPLSIINPIPSTHPVMIFGHGLFGSAEGEMMTMYQRELIDKDLQMVQIGTNWIGASVEDSVTMASKILFNINLIKTMTDRMLQAHINFTILTKLVKFQLKNDTKIRNFINPEEIYYYGISNGGVQGGTFMGINPYVIKGVLNVPGAAWTQMMQRNIMWPFLNIMLTTNYSEDPLEILKLLSLIQFYFDFVDPISFAPYVVKNPLPDTPEKKVLIQEAIGDAQVPNFATEMLARTMGIPGLKPLVYPVFGIEEVEGPIDGSALTQWNPMNMKNIQIEDKILPECGPYPPEGNIALAHDNCAHEAIRRLPALRRQLKEFLKPDGKIVQTCDGVCDPE
jgi:hypothetical protein